MDLDQLPAAEQLDQRRVGAGIQVAAQVLLGAEYSARPTSTWKSR
jgi:hypothetical protein